MWLFLSIEQEKSSLCGIIMNYWMLQLVFVESVISLFSYSSIMISDNPIQSRLVGTALINISNLIPILGNLAVVLSIKMVALGADGVAAGH